MAKAEKIVLDSGAAKVESFTSDLRDPQQTSTLIAKILANGPVDILCNNAGIQRTGLIENLSRETWDDILAVNLTSYFDTMKLLLPQMRERGYGRVINTSSVHGLIASVEKAPYVAAKHGVVGPTKVAALLVLLSKAICDETSPLTTYAFNGACALLIDCAICD